MSQTYRPCRKCWAEATPEARRRNTSVRPPLIAHEGHNVAGYCDDCWSGLTRPARRRIEREVMKELKRR